MYFLVEKLNNIKRTVLDDDCFLVTKNNMVTTLEKREIVQLGTNITGITKKGHFLFLESFSETDGLEKTEIYDLEVNEFVSYPGLERIMLRNGFNEDNVIALFYDNEFNTKAGVLNFDHSGKALFREYNIDFEVSLFKLEDDILVLSDKFSVYLYKLNEHNNYICFSLKPLPDWEDVNGAVFPAELSSIIGVYKSLLWLHLKQFYLIAIDIHTGEIRHTIFLPEVFGFPVSGPWQNRMSIGDMHLDEEKGVIKSLAHWRYWEFDLNSLKGSIRKDFGHPVKDLPHAWSINKSWFYPGDNNLYFIGKRQQQNFDTVIGIFDTEAAVVTWYDEPFPSQGGAHFIPVLQLNGKYMAIQDSEMNAWLYERK